MASRDPGAEAGARPPLHAAVGTKHMGPSWDSPHQAPVGGRGRVWSCEPRHRSEAPAGLGLGKAPGCSRRQQGEGFTQKALTCFTQTLAPRPAVVVPTRICYFYVILHMKEIGDVEFVQIGGVLQQKEHTQQSEPGSKGWAGGLRILGPEGERPGAAQRSGLSSRERRAPGVRSRLCPGRATSRGGDSGTLCPLLPGTRLMSTNGRSSRGCGQAWGSHLRPPTAPRAPCSPDATEPAVPRALVTASPPRGREHTWTADEDGTCQGQEWPTKAISGVSKSRSFRNPLRADT